jgi:hypothetical protein
VFIYFDTQHDTYKYKIAGMSYFDFNDGFKMQSGNCMLFDGGDAVMVITGQEGVPFLLVSGKIRESFVWCGYSPAFIRKVGFY